MASCTKIEHWIQSYIDGEQSDSERVIFEKHVHECSRCQELLNEQRRCTADMFETFSGVKLQDSLTPYVMDHLPEMIDLQKGTRELAMVNKRAKHPRSWSALMMRAVPVAVAMMLVYLGYVLKVNWPEEMVPDTVIGSVTHQDGTAFRIDDASDERTASALKAFAMPGDRFETSLDTTMMITLLGPSTIKLAPETRVRINSDRRISVEKGRVFLDVSKGTRMFRVFTPESDITVFGTSFDVNVELNTTTVSVAEGEVQVESAEHFTQITPGEQVEVTTEETALIPRHVDILAVPSWADAIQPDVEAQHFFMSRIAPNADDSVIQADNAYVLSPLGNRINYIEVEWEVTPALRKTRGYQVYVFSGDDNSLMFQGEIPAEMLKNSKNTSVRIYNRTSPDARLQFAYVRVVPNYNNGKGDAKFTSCRANLIR